MVGVDGCTVGVCVCLHLCNRLVLEYMYMLQYVSLVNKTIALVKLKQHEIERGLDLATSLETVEKCSTYSTWFTVIEL